jgi:hypothetical protein
MIDRTDAGYLAHRRRGARARLALAATAEEIENNRPTYQTKQKRNRSASSSHSIACRRASISSSAATSRVASCTALLLMSGRVKVGRDASGSPRGAVE